MGGDFLEYTMFLSGLIQLLVSLFLAVGALYFGIIVFSKLTPGINEITELKKGNVAVGVLMASIIIAIAVIVQSGIAGFLASIAGVSRPVMSHLGQLACAAIGALLQLALGVVLAVVSIHIAIWILDRYTPDIDEYAELKRGNVSLSILLGAIVIAVAFIIQVGVDALMAAFS